MTCRRVCSRFFDACARYVDGTRMLSARIAMKRARIVWTLNASAALNGYWTPEPSLFLTAEMDRGRR